MEKLVNVTDLNMIKDSYVKLLWISEDFVYLAYLAMNADPQIKTPTTNANTISVN